MNQIRVSNKEFRITGKDLDFHAIFNSDEQRYSIYKNEKFIKYEYSLRIVKNYID